MAVKEKDFAKAGDIIAQTNSLLPSAAESARRKCSVKENAYAHQGEPVGTRALGTLCADWNMEHNEKETPSPQTNGKRVAVIGAGPSGLTCAGDLAKKGYEVTIFEAFHKAGGVLVYRHSPVPSAKEIVQKEIDKLIAMASKIETKHIIGKTFTVDEIFEMGYQTVFIGSGAGLPSFMNIPEKTCSGYIRQTSISRESIR